MVRDHAAVNVKALALVKKLGVTPEANATSTSLSKGAAEKMEALKAHRTQISVDGPFFALSNNVGNEAWGLEFFRIVKGTQGELNEDGLETDLFAGL